MRFAFPRSCPTTASVLRTLYNDQPIFLKPTAPLHPTASRGSRLVKNQKITGQNLLAPLKEAKRFIIKLFGRLFSI
jgi:hypothetical protein